MKCLLIYFRQILEYWRSITNPGKLYSAEQQCQGLAATYDRAEQYVSRAAKINTKTFSSWQIIKHQKSWYSLAIISGLNNWMIGDSTIALDPQGCDFGGKKAVFYHERLEIWRTFALVILSLKVWSTSHSPISYSCHLIHSMAFCYILQFEDIFQILTAKIQGKFFSTFRHKKDVTLILH